MLQDMTPIETIEQSTLNCCLSNHRLFQRLFLFIYELILRSAVQYLLKKMQGIMLERLKVKY